MTDLSINVTDSVVPEFDVRVLAERLTTGVGGQLAKSGDYAHVRRCQVQDGGQHGQRLARRGG
jgi:hypothetical protein